MSKIPFLSPDIGQLEKEYLLDAFNSTWIGGRGEYIDRFESAFAKFIGVKHACTTSNGTTALHLAYIACGMRNNSTVTIPKNTFCATGNMAKLITQSTYDIESNPKTWNINLKDLSTDFVVGVHLYGNPVDMGQVYRAKYTFIEDCAHAIGSEYRWKKCGSFGQASCFSFHAAKMLACGEGGMVCTNDYLIDKQVRLLKDQAMIEPYRHAHLGFNYRMTNLQAAIGLAQLERVDELMDKKRKITKFYDENLDKNFIRQENSPHTKVVKWANAYRHPKAKEIRQKLSDVGIETRPGFVGEDIIVLPSGTTLTKEQLENVAREINQFSN